MSKSDAPLSDIDTSRARGGLRAPTWLDKEVVAFDTETADGEVFMVSSARAGGRSDVMDSGGSTLDGERVFAFLMSRQFRDTLNVWYNLKFDANVVLSEALETDALEELTATCSTVATVAGTEYDITYIPGKLLTADTTSEGRNTVSHFDVSTYFRSSLEDAASEWLPDGDGKLTGPDAPDVTRFGELEYRVRHIDSIREYARVDAEVTRDLTRAFARVAESEVGVPFGRPVSTGYLAAEFFREHLSDKPGWGLTPVQSMAWDSYAGGRFEVFQRGAVGEVAGPDINSAYPAVMAELPDPGSVSWGVLENPDRADVLDADWGFVRGSFHTSDATIQPFPVKRDGIVTFPRLRGETTTVTLPEYRLAHEWGLIESETLERATVGHETDATTYPFDFVSDLYDQRKEWERNGHELRATVLKIVLNSMYGKTAQTTRKRTVPDGPVDPSTLDPVERIGSAFGRALVERLDAGEFFNPILASYITAETRVMLHRAVLEHGLTDDTVLMATDCLMVDADAYRESDFDHRLGDSLGEWDFDYQGDAFVVGSGVYEVDTGHRPGGDGLKTSTRGFREATLDGGLRAEARRASGDIDIESDRPTTLGEALTRPGDFSLSDVGAFRSTARGLAPDFDRKREWPAASWSTLLDGAQSSDPLDLGRLEREEALEEASARSRASVESFDSMATDPHAQRDSTLSAAENRQALEAARRARARTDFE